MHTLARAPAQTTLHASRRPLSPVRGWGRGASNHDVMLRRPPRQPDSNDQVIEDIIAHSGIPGGIAAALRHETVQPLHGVDDRHAFGQRPVAHARDQGVGVNRPIRRILPPLRVDGKIAQLHRHEHSRVPVEKG